ncbi:hypothetical protein [Actinoallomurus sp. NPDC052274]
MGVRTVHLGGPAVWARVHRREHPHQARAPEDDHVGTLIVEATRDK